MMIGYSNRDSRLFYKMHIWDCQTIFYASFVCSLHESLLLSEQFQFLNGQFGHDVVLIKAKMPTQHIRRIRTMALETFKILNGLALPVLSNLVQKQDNKYNFRYTNLLQIPQVKSSRYGKSSFRYAAPVLWNSLPDNYRNCSNFNEFKNLISFWNGKSCTCIICQNS